MRVEELVIDGFKSYSVRTVITPWDSQFNAITGLNGSGKSNILDAICFVLGITSTSSLRAFNMQDLIYKKGQAGVTKASVTITFDNSDKENSPVNRKNDAKISITRKIQVENQNSTSSKYLINGRKATQKEVANMLQSVQLNINNPNFLIMQGKITQMLNMKPKQILNLIEEAAGTKSYESQRESSIKIINKKQNKLNTIRSTLKEEVEPKLAELQRQTEIVFEFKDKSSERDTYLQILAALNYSKGKEILAQIQPEFEKSKMKLNELNSSIENFENQIVELEKQINEIKSKSQNNNSESNKLLKDLENTEKALINEITRMKTSRDLNISQIDDYKLKIEQNKVNINEINQSLLNNNENFENMQKEFKKEEENLANFKTSLNKKEDLVSTLSTGISSKGTDAGYNAQLRDANKKLTETKTIIEQKKLQINDLKNSLDTNLKKVHETEILKIKTTINEKEKNIELLKDQLRKMGFDQPEYDSLRNEEKHLLQELNQKNRQLQDFIGHDSRFDFHYEKPTSDFDPSSVKGLCGELFELPENNNRASTALEVCAGFKLFNVVVDTEKTGSLLLDKGNLRKRVTIIPLNKINSKVLNSNILQEAKKISPNKVELALNLVNYDGTVEKAIEYIFGNKLICDDPETAKKVTFNDKIRTSSITLDGDNYDPEGRLSGGSRRNNSSTIYKFAKYRVLREQIHNIESSLHEVSKKLNRMNSAVEKNRGIQQQLTKEEFYLNSLQAKLSNSDSIKYIERFEGNSKLIKELQQSVETDLYSLKTTQNEIAQINKDMQEFNSNGSAKLNEIRKEIKQMKAELHSKENKLNKRRLTLNSESVQKEDLLNDLETLSNNNSNMTEEIKKLEILIEEQEEAINDNQLKLDELSQNISDEKKVIASTVVELNALSEHLSNTKDRLDDYKSQKDSMLANANQLKHMKKQAESNINNAVQEFEWMENDARRNEILMKNPNVDNKICESKIEECDKRITQLREKGADENIIQQSTTLIQLKEDLVKKITKIEKDKEKIQSTVAKLDEHLKTKLEDTFQKVSADFGETFALLLPDAYAKLEKTDKNGDITKGLEVKVRLGSIWKESLVELSGGQRSLVALALIMSLLQYNPAPLYILDEVDAALDLSHTQSIGHLIKTKFKGAQFIVVSLKEGMFTNANQLFKVRFQDGTSVVTPTNRRI